MPAFTLGHHRLDLTIEPLAGDHAVVERRVAWRLYLQLATALELRCDAPGGADLAQLIGRLRDILGDWPAAEIPAASVCQLGPAMLEVIDLILMPCVQDAAPPHAWAAVRSFCQALARELARRYRFHPLASAMPQDLASAWREAP